MSATTSEFGRDSGGPAAPGRALARWVDALSQDLRYAFRTLRREKTFALIAVITLALGIGANVAVFSVVNTILLRPLPFPEAQQLTWISPPPSGCGESCETYSADAYEEFRAQNRAFSDVTAWFAFSIADNYRLTGHGESTPATGIGVAGNFFQVLGVRPALGRLFTADEGLKNSRPVVLLANAYWRRQFGGDSSIVGRAIELNDQSVTVVGVLPASFDFGAVFSPGVRVDLFTPLILDDMRDYGNIVTMIGRLKPGVTIAQAQADANRVAPNLYFNVKRANSNRLRNHPRYETIVSSLKQHVAGRLRRSLIMLWSAVGMILLIVCVNLSNLLLSRAAARSREFALRSALGADTRRIVRQLLTESLALAGAGALLGLALAWAITSFVAHQDSVALPLLGEVRIDAAALAWTLLAAIAAGVLIGVAPALKLAGPDLVSSLKQSGQGLTEGRRNERLRSALVISEVALACVLLIGAGLLLRSFLRVLDIDLGFQPARAAAMKVDYQFTLNGSEKADAEKRNVTFHQIVTEVQSLPGIEAAGIVDYLPLGQNRSWGPPVPVGRVASAGELPSPFVYMITPGYLRAMGIRLLAGRDFTWADGPESENVILVDETVARELWPNQDAVDRLVQMNGRVNRIVGVIADVHQAGVEQAAGWQVYFPIGQQYPAGAELVVRSPLPPSALGSAILGKLRELNPEQSATELRPIEQLVDHAVSPRRFFAWLVSAFAGLGLLLATLGIYGVIAYSVVRQTQEIGIRMALGASTARVLWSVMLRTLRVAGIGVVIGAMLSFALAHAIASLLYGIAPSDPLTFGAVILLLAGVALLAGYLPARRAAGIEPTIALRAN
jgi:predicted permease